MGRRLRQQDQRRALEGVVGVVRANRDSSGGPAEGVGMRAEQGGGRAGANGGVWHAAFNPADGRIAPVDGAISSPAMTTSVVTGGAGFLGSHMCDALLHKGHRVICVDNLDTGSLQNVEHIEDERFTFLMHDLTEPLFIDEPVDFVYHLASPASPIDYQRLPLHTLKVGSYGTHHMLGLAKIKRARFVLASTSEVYGDPQVHPQPEDYWGHVNPIGPRGVYDEAKRYAEALTMAYHRQQGVDTGIVRTFNTYGPRMRPHDGRAIPTFLRQALQNKPLTVFGDGSQTRSFCFVADQIRGYIAMAESDVHVPVNIGNPNEFTLLELAEAVIEVAESQSEIVFEALPTDDPQVRQPEITRAKQLLGWGPEVELREGLTRTIEEAGIAQLVGATR
jgi:dTDP-glucose 4,6-dehydratase